MKLMMALFGDEIDFKTKIEKGTPFNRSITKSIEQTSKFTEANAESRTKKKYIPVACLRQLFVVPFLKSILFELLLIERSTNLIILKLKRPLKQLHIQERFSEDHSVISRLQTRTFSELNLELENCLS